jgi:drug/metabolite transporter (DMT)-like permease
MIVYRFQPLYLAAMAYLFLGQTLSGQQLFAVGLLIACVLILSHEGKRQLGRWDLAGVGIAFTGMILDGTGVLLSRIGFENAPSLTAAQANIIRCGGALFGFWVISLLHRPKGLALKETFVSLEPRYQFLAVASSVLGTFLGLFLWLKALSTGNVAQVAAMGGLSPVIAVAIESFLTRKWPGPHALAALGLCLVAVGLLI